MPYVPPSERSPLSALTVNRLCASSLAAVNLAARAIRCEDADIIIAGGVESMSRAPYSLPKAEQPYPFGNLTAWDTALGWRYPNPRMPSPWKATGAPSPP
jgi:acetyl-CoA acetyltransferase